MIAAALASIQALLLFVVLRMLQDSGISLRWFVPIVALTTLALVAWLGLVRAAFGRVVPLGQAPAAAILETLEAVRGALRGGFDAASAQVVAYEIRERLGYAAVSVCDRERVLAHVGLGADHHGAGLPGAARRRRRDDRASRLAPAGRLEARLRRSRLPAALGHRRADRRTAATPIGAIVLFSETALAVSDRDRAIARHLGALVSTEVMLGELDLHARATASAELAAMQAQIEPHFLFNALNTIAAFCRTQPEEARRLVLAFAEYCRSACAARTRSCRCATSCATSRPTSRSSARASATRSRSTCASRRPPSWRSCRRCSCNRWSRTRSSTARPTGRCASSCARGALRPAAHHRARQRPRHPARARRPRARAGRRLGRGRARPGLGRAARRRRSTASTGACASSRRRASVRSSRS